jgi:signal transduction histidine kinase
LVGAGAALAGVTILGNARANNVGWFAVVVLGMWLVLTATRRDGLLLWTGSLAVYAVEWIWISRDLGWAAWIGGTTFAVVAGFVVRHELDLVEQLRAAQAGLAEHARDEERNRIARELHDIIAHSLTVSLLHIGSARLALEHDARDAARALEEAERLSRASLDEVRSAVGLLRTDDTASSSVAAPLPGFGELPALVDSFTAAGTTVFFTRDGDGDRVSATVGLALYRIVQEALTNAVKHARGAPVFVDLRVDERHAQLLVDSAGEPGAGGGHGHGLVNMRERAESLGGSCCAGPGGHGWIVDVSIPMSPGGVAP